MTIGQEFNAYANNLEEEILNLERNVKLLHEINMGGTAHRHRIECRSRFRKTLCGQLEQTHGRKLRFSQ